MGLDMYAYTVKRDKKNKPLKYHESLARLKETWYWWNFYELNDIMFQLYLSKGGEGEFNCDDLMITQEDIDELRENLLENPEITKEAQEKILQFFNEAENKIEQGYQIYYTNWW